MIMPADAVRLLVQACPSVRAELIKDVENWLCEDGSLSAHMIFASASHHVAEKLLNGEVEKVAPVFEFIERSLLEGDQDVKNGAATCFLENLMNRDIDARLYSSKLGRESLAFCRAWDAFTGVETPGLDESLGGN
jgi:hypothetical protein